MRNCYRDRLLNGGVRFTFEIAVRVRGSACVGVLISYCLTENRKRRRRQLTPMHEPDLHGSTFTVRALGYLGGLR